jgi:hypothetical protein
MKKADQVFRMLGDLYEFHKRLSRFRIRENVEAGKSPRSREVPHPSSNKETGQAPDRE